MLANFKTAYLSLLVLILVLISLTDAHASSWKSILNSDKRMETKQHSLESIFRVRRTYIDENENCGSHELEMVHTIMDRICMLCHELRSHFAPNTRVECRKDCFQNDTFQSCMKIFSRVPSRPVQQPEPTAPIPLYTENVQTLDDFKERRRRL
ncbi:uncharacterized protein CELE_C05E11.6 [Caenorhabditis elegans]|uniref:Uncharacterized protein n=1 Tax=Caenorhabditis elegans TaxID=6239 RepID=Q17662_CAEEL|nr:Uncharacterized protein CELE_C05E11.6 [Caenorhabditis elegans]CCD63262.1 Uncharacterized protein CELE_C05E11.6 [Caenorhabditis elegans]|eukprot:NP_508782.2 Uncharacterized protein CELE_C05E11.6 [Caenorhabditis elegans]